MRITRDAPRRRSIIPGQRCPRPCDFRRSAACGPAENSGLGPHDCEPVRRGGHDGCKCRHSSALAPGAPRDNARPLGLGGPSDFGPYARLIMTISAGRGSVTKLPAGADERNRSPGQVSVTSRPGWAGAVCPWPCESPRCVASESPHLVDLIHRGCPPVGDGVGASQHRTDRGTNAIEVSEGADGHCHRL